MARTPRLPARALLVLLLAAVFCIQTAAADLDGELSFRRFTTLDGLPQMQTETIWQDSRGYIYIGTLSGFVRYDGVSLRSYLGGRRENIVQFRELDGRILPMSFVRRWSVKGSSATASPIDPDGQLLLNNLNAADLPPSHVLMEDRQEQNRVLCRLTADGIEKILQTPALDEMSPDRKLYMDSSGVYIPTPRGLFLAEGGRVRKFSSKGDVYSLARSGGGVLALCGDGIYTVGRDSLSLVFGHRFEAPDYGLSARLNAKGGLVIADAHTIWLYEGGPCGGMRPLASGFNLIRGVFIDKWNRLWAATYQGAYCFFHCNFELHRLSDRNDIVRAVAPSGGHLVMGTLNGKVLFDGQIVDEAGDNFYNPGAAALGGTVYMAGNGDVVGVTDGTLKWLGLPHDRYRFVSTAGGRVIIGASRSVLSYTPATGRLDTLTTEIARPWCAAPGEDGRLWIGGNPGLYMMTGMEEGSPAVTMVMATPTTPVISSMASDGKGGVFFSLGDKVYSIRGEQVDCMDGLEPFLSGHEIRSLHVSRKGNLVVAAMDGILVAALDDEGRPGDRQWFDSRSGFTIIEPLLGNMAEEEDGTVWLPGLEEMVSFNPDDLLTDNRDSTTVQMPLPWWRRWWTVLIAAMLLSLAVWGLSRWSGQRQVRKKMAELEREKTQKELQLRAVRLKAIPHFHSNVISSIEYFVMNKSSDEASHYLKLYSDFTNRTLSDIDKPCRSISREVEYVRGYLELEKLRFGDRLQYSIEVDPDVDQNIQLPTMLLHTYCENAVKHGIASKVGAGSVEVRIGRQKRDGADGVLVSVRDDGVGRSEAARSGGSPGHGLKILRQQIELYNQTNTRHIVQSVADLSDAQGHPAGTCFETWVPADYKF